MNDLDIFLINVICYMGGILSGLGFCFKYKKHLLIRTSSKEQLSDIVNSITNEISNNTNPGPPIMASAPHQSALKEIVIRSTE